MRSDELLDLFRKDVLDTAQPFFWSDEEVYAYMNDAYFMFVRLTGGIPDAVGPACSIRAAKGELYAPMHKTIMRIREATLMPEGRKIRVINAQDMDQLTDEDYGILRSINSPQSIGKVSHMVIGMQQDVARWVQIPDKDYQLHLLIERLPYEPITGGDQQLKDVKEHHHLHLMKWMRHLCYFKQDADTFDKVKSDQEKAAFMEYCNFAKREKDTAKHKVRVVQYGGL